MDVRCIDGERREIAAVSICWTAGRAIAEGTAARTDRPHEREMERRSGDKFLRGGRATSQHLRLGRRKAGNRSHSDRPGNAIVRGAESFPGAYGTQVTRL